MKDNEEKKDKTAETAAEESATGKEVSAEETAAETQAGEDAKAADAGGEDTAEQTADEGGETEQTAGESAGMEPEKDETANGEKNGLFGRKKKKDKRDEKIEELTDRVKRTMAEFENFRKRNEREKAQMYEIGARDIIEKMLPVLDNFERGLAAIPEDQKDGAVAQGMEMICKQMQTVFDQIGVKEIEAAGKEFDPDFHNAVMHEENDEVGENVVTEVLQKGYTYRDSVIRHSMVKVAN